MTSIKDSLVSTINRFSSQRIARQPVTLFCKSIYSYLAIKILLIWSFTGMLVEIHDYPLPQSGAGKLVFFLQPWMAANINEFLGLTLAVTILCIVIPRNYFTAALIFWLNLNLYRIHIPVINGSDILLNMLLFLIIPLSDRPAIRHSTIHALQIVTHNFALVYTRIQIAAIYLVSGVDKLISAAWRSGEATHNITHLNFMFNPHMKDLVPENNLFFIITAWIVILFEILFPVLVWWNMTRRAVLITGVLFHLVIWLVLSLPDFGIIMILTYAIFLTDKELGKWFQILKKRSIILKTATQA